MSADKLSLYMNIFISVVVLFFILWGISYVLFRRPRKKQDEDAASGTGFVMDTFHGLVAQLKEKERELEALRSRAEERAGIAEDYNENILQSVPSGVVTMDESWKIVKANAAACRILGVEIGSLVGADFRSVFQDDRMHSVSRREESGFDTPDGRRLWLGYSLSPLEDSEGKALGRIFVFTDLTELQALHRQAELRLRLSSLGEMSAGIAHELKNSMGVIRGYMDLLSSRADEGLNETVSAISSEVGIMDRIVTDFLSFARPQKLNVAEVALLDLCGTASQAALHGREDVMLDIDVSEDLKLEGDEVLLRQALTNLLQNASEATGPGGRISVAARAGDGRALITVSDTGHGIDEEGRDKLFLPFYTTKDGGTGLGLAIVHRVVAQHGGDVEIGPGQGGSGTIVTIKLPLRQSSEDIT